MGVYKRGETWWYTFTSSDGSRVQESARTTDKQAAEETYERHKAQVCGDRLGTRSKRTWKEAVVQWCKEKTHKRTLDKDLETFQWLDRFLCRKALEDIDRDLLSRIQEAKREETSESTANRTMALHSEAPDPLSDPRGNRPGAVLPPEAPAAAVQVCIGRRT
jgi:hypothetical protein